MVPTDTVFVQVLAEPFNIVPSDKVKLPVAPAVTVIDEPVAEPTIVPLPEITQL